MTNKRSVDLGDVQHTLFIPVVARAAETRRKHPALRDPKAVEIVESIEFDPVYAANWGGFLTVARTLIFDEWVRDFLREHPAGTVAELGTGLNTRFERVDNGRCHWIDLDLPDTIEVRRRFFTDTDRRQMVPASVLDDDWLDVVAECPAQYLFVCEGVLPYLQEDAVRSTLARIAARFPGALIALDTYGQRSMRQQHQAAQRRGLAARWQWACDDPRTLESAGLRLVASVATTDPPALVRRGLPARYRWLLRLVAPGLRNSFTISLFRAAD